MNTKSHTHPCVRCGQRFECDGTETRNFDGWPLVVCAVFHEARMDLCPPCTAWLDGDDDAPNQGHASDRRSA